MYTDIHMYTVIRIPATASPAIGQPESTRGEAHQRSMASFDPPPVSRPGCLPQTDALLLQGVVAFHMASLTPTGIFSFFPIGIGPGYYSTRRYDKLPLRNFMMIIVYPREPLPPSLTPTGIPSLVYVAIG